MGCSSSFRLFGFGSAFAFNRGFVDQHHRNVVADRINRWHSTHFKPLPSGFNSTFALQAGQASISNKS